MASNHEMAKKRSDVIGWLNGLFSDFNMPLDASEEEFRARLVDGTVLCAILRRLCPDYLEEARGGDHVNMFLSALERLNMPHFKISDLEQGPISAVVVCLLSLRDHLISRIGEDKEPNSLIKGDSEARRRWRLLEGSRLEAMDVLRRENAQGSQNTEGLGQERKQSLLETKFQRILRNSVMSEPSSPLSRHAGHKFHEVFQMKQGGYSDIPAAKISEMMKSNSLDNAPTQSLLSVVNGILDESIERKNGEIPYRVACLLRKVIQEIERRISTQAEHIRNQNNLIKAREEKYQSRIKVLETLATGTSEETQIVVNQLQQIKTKKNRVEEKRKLEEEDVVSLMKEKENNDFIVSKLKQDLEETKKSYEEQRRLLETKKEDVVRIMKDKENSDHIISNLKQELEITKRLHEQQCHRLETKAMEIKVELEQRIKEVELLLEESRRRTKDLETFSESKYQNWNEKENILHKFMSLQLHSVQDLRLSSVSIRHEVLNTQKKWSEELNSMGQRLKVLTDAAENYYATLAENRRLFNEVQELKGNIRVYCRIRPFLAGENQKLTTIEYIGDNGELLLANPSKQGKDGHRMFTFNKVFAPVSTQEEVFVDIRPLIRSVLDGYNVCIFAYGQTGSGKTYTMTGPNSASEKDWGVNYRALNDLFHISQKRQDTFMYEISVQMVEIYNEQVRDLLLNDGSQKKLGILHTSQPNGLAVPGASMHPVKSTSDVIELMQIGLANRAVGATALNDRSSRSHSIVTVHVRAMDLKTGATLRGSLHLVDLAGSERVDRSEVTGDRLKEAQHINKSLSALGDVIFALSQKSAHVPYRNSKLTQVLQSSLGGHAKTLMFVQINPDVLSYSETFSTLKFAERVSGVELGVAKSQKEGKDVRELMEQVAFLKDTIARKDDEIEHLQLFKDRKTKSPSLKAERHSNSELKHSSSSPGMSSLGGTTLQGKKLYGKMTLTSNKAASDPEVFSDYSDKHSESGSLQSVDDIRQQKETAGQSKLATGETGQNSVDLELVGFGDADSDERLSDISDSGLSMGTETDGSISSVVEFTLFPERDKQSDTTKLKVSRIPTRVPKPSLQKRQANVLGHKLKETPKSPSLRRSTDSQATSSPRTPKRWQ
ncbi:kinesin-like protein KIN-14M isoform X1 [Typha angustifolia]|uniref:kinesin-like protein KIN-14M isoform X1 n=1 Tax=Typha angustifolia TaxID=59011 RepID=UPI003C2F54F4